VDATFVPGVLLARLPLVYLRVEVETCQDTCAAYCGSLLAKPALGCLAPSLQDNGVALQTRCHVVPSRFDELVLAA